LEGERNKKFFFHGQSKNPNFLFFSQFHFTPFIQFDSSIHVVLVLEWADEIEEQGLPDDLKKMFEI
jgi:hypothetical protein